MPMCSALLYCCHLPTLPPQQAPSDSAPDVWLQLQEHCSKRASDCEDLRSKTADIVSKTQAVRLSADS